MLQFSSLTFTCVSLVLILILLVLILIVLILILLVLILILLVLILINITFSIYEIATIIKCDHKSMILLQKMAKTIYSL